MSGAYKSMLNFLDKSKKRPTALIRVNDIIVIGAINAIKEYGLNVSGNISIMGLGGFGDHYSSNITCHNLLEGSRYPLYLY